MAHLLRSVALPDALSTAPPPRGLKLIRSETFRRLRTRSARLAARDGLIVSFTRRGRPGASGSRRGCAGRRCVPRRGRGHASRWIQIGYAASDGPVARSLGLLAAAQGDTRAAAAHLEHALRLCAAAGAPAFEARARADLAGLERDGARSSQM
jgi:hypothetical protein